MVSILVAVHNRERYLGDCLESILHSTWQDFEVIVVDDQSTDRSLTIAYEFAKRDTRISVTSNEQNVGQFPNRMRAASLARGRYIKYVDSDDVIYPHGLRVMVEAMESNRGAALGLSHSKPEETAPYPFKLNPADAWRKEFLGDGCLGCGPTGAIIDRERFFEIGGFASHGLLGDTDLWFRMSARWPVLLLPPALAWWRRHDEQEFSTGGAATFYLEHGFSLVMESLESPECPLGDAERREAIARARQHYARRLLSLAIRRRKPRVALSLMRKSGVSGAELLKGFAPYR